MEKYHGNTVEYWKQNAEEDYIKTPISVLKYITVLEEQVEQLRKHTVSAYRDELLEKFDSMVISANRMFNEEAKKVTEMVIDNVKHHVSEIAKKHYH